MRPPPVLIPHPIARKVRARWMSSTRTCPCAVLAWAPTDVASIFSHAVALHKKLITRGEWAMARPCGNFSSVGQMCVPVGYGVRAPRSASARVARWISCVFFASTLALSRAITASCAARCSVTARCSRARMRCFVCCLAVSNTLISSSKAHLRSSVIPEERSPSHILWRSTRRFTR